MQKRLLYSVLTIASLAMLLFVAGFVCWQLGLGLLSESIYRLAGKIMLLAFVSLMLLGVFALIYAVWRDLRAYWNIETRALRRLQALRSQNLANRQRMLSQAMQVQFWAGIKRKRLLMANNHKHTQSLFRAINNELKAVKTQLTSEAYKASRNTLREHYKRADAGAMLALRNRLPCR